MERRRKTDVTQPATEQIARVINTSSGLTDALDVTTMLTATPVKMPKPTAKPSTNVVIPRLLMPGKLARPFAGRVLIGRSGITGFRQDRALLAAKPVGPLRGR